MKIPTFGVMQLALMATLKLSPLIVLADTENTVGEAQARSLVAKIAQTVELNYISQAVATEMADSIRSNQKEGAYNDLTLQEFAQNVQSDLRAVSDDRHMSINIEPRESSQQEGRLARKLTKWGERSNFGHTEIRLLECNIGYLKISHFTQPRFLTHAKQVVDRSLRTLRHQDAIIIDLRDNPGGFEEIVAYLVSYFVEGKAVLQRYYCRYIDRETTISVTEELPGTKLPQIPLYILVNRNTGSAGESFAYIMKHLQRATIVGETTVGAGNGAARFRVSDELTVLVSTCETINEVTKTSWEKQGVLPHIETTSDASLGKAIELAATDARSYRGDLNQRYAAAVADLDAILHHADDDVVELAVVIGTLDTCRELGLLNQGEINSLGYDLLNAGRLRLADAVLKANTLFFPDSANGFDSYGDALTANGKLEQACRCYERAVELGTNSNSEFLPTFKKNLEAARRRLRDSEPAARGN